MSPPRRGTSSSDGYCAYTPDADFDGTHVDGEGVFAQFFSIRSGGSLCHCEHTGNFGWLISRVFVAGNARCGNDDRVVVCPVLPLLTGDRCKRNE